MDTGALSSLLWFVIIGALFYFIMHRGGCGGHAHGGHNQHGGHSHGGSKTGKTKDPVCGMEIEVTGATMRRQHMGQTFYFCSSKCMEKFDKDPMAYMGSAQGPSQGHGGCC